MSLAGRTVLQMDQAAPAHQSLLRRVGERGQNANLDGHRGVRAGGHRPQTAGARLGTPFGPANSQRLPVRESSLDSSAYPKQRAIAIISIPQPTENVQHLTGHSWLVARNKTNCKVAWNQARRGGTGSATPRSSPRCSCVEKFKAC